MTWRQIAAVLVLAAVSAPRAAGAPAPEELWQEFPLEPPPATTPAQAPAAPAPISPLTPPALPTGQATEEEADEPAFLSWLGANAPTIVALGSLILIAMAGAHAAAAALRRRESLARPATAAPGPGEEAAVGGMPGDLVDRVRVATGAPRESPERSRSPVPVKAAPPRTAESFEPEARRLEECEIACSPRAGFWHFHVVSHGEIVDSLLSPAFGAPGYGAPQQTDAAVRAHEALVDRLIDAGWEEQGRGEAWFATRFRRLSA